MSNLLLNPYTEFIIPNILFLFSSHSLCLNISSYVSWPFGFVFIQVFCLFYVLLNIDSFYCCCSVSCSVISDSAAAWTAAYHCPSPSPTACSNSCPLSQRCHPTISSSVVPFSCLQSFPASGSFLMSQFFASGDPSIGVSASASVLPMNIQNWFYLGWTGWISLQSKGLSRVFSNTTVQKHQFFGTQLSLWSNSHIHTW